MRCSVDECEHEAKEGPLCFGHARRKRRGQSLTKLRPYGRTGKQRLLDAIHRYADAETDEDEQRALANLLKAVQRLRRRRKDIVRNDNHSPG